MKLTASRLTLNPLPPSPPPTLTDVWIELGKCLVCSRNVTDDLLLIFSVISLLMDLTLPSLTYELAASMISGEGSMKVELSSCLERNSTRWRFSELSSYFVRLILESYGDGLTVHVPSFLTPDPPL